MVSGLFWSDIARRGYSLLEHSFRFWGFVSSWYILKNLSSFFQGLGFCIWTAVYGYSFKSVGSYAVSMPFKEKHSLKLHLFISSSKTLIFLTSCLCYQNCGCITWIGKLMHKLETTKAVDPFELRHIILAHNIMTHSLHASHRNLKLSIYCGNRICVCDLHYFFNSISLVWCEL